MRNQYTVRSVPVAKFFFDVVNDSCMGAMAQALYLYLARRAFETGRFGIEASAKTQLEKLQTSNPTLTRARNELAGAGLISAQEIRHGIWFYELLDPKTKKILYRRSDLSFNGQWNDEDYESYLRERFPHSVIVKRSDGTVKLHCPFHAHTKEPKLTFNLAKRCCWYCYTCKEGGAAREFELKYQSIVNGQEISISDAHTRFAEIVETSLQGRLDQYGKKMDEQMDAQLGMLPVRATDDLHSTQAI